MGTLHLTKCSLHCCLEMKATHQTEVLLPCTVWTWYGILDSPPRQVGVYWHVYKGHVGVCWHIHKWPEYLQYFAVAMCYLQLPLTSRTKHLLLSKQAKGVCRAADATISGFGGLVPARAMDNHRISCFANSIQDALVLLSSSSTSPTHAHTKHACSLPPPFKPPVQRPINPALQTNQAISHAVWKRRERESKGRQTSREIGRWTSEPLSGWFHSPFHTSPGGSGGRLHSHEHTHTCTSMHTHTHFILSAVKAPAGCHRPPLRSVSPCLPTCLFLCTFLP